MCSSDLMTRLKVLLLALAFAVIANWLRVFTLIVVGHLSDMQHYLVARSHYGYGWALFTIAMVGFFMAESRIAGRHGTTGNLLAIPTEVDRDSSRWWPRVVAVGVLMATIAFWSWLTSRPAAVATSAAKAGSGWSESASAESDWAPVVRGADSITRRSYTDSSGGQIDWHDFVFLTQHQGKELGGYYDDLAGGMEQLETRATVISGMPLRLIRARDAADLEWLVAASYRSGKWSSESALHAQLMYAAGSMLQLRSILSDVRVWRARCEPDCDAAERRLGEFLAAVEQ